MEPSTRPLKILLIDDNENFAYVTSSLLELYGYDVVVSDTGEGGVETAKAYYPDVILCDIGLPDIVGFEVAKRIRSCLEIKDAYLIAISGYAQFSDIERAKAAGFDLHIGKPVQIENLKRILDALQLRNAH